MTRLQFFLFDIVYKIVDEKPVIHMYGRTKDDRQVCVTDRSFRPYFYIRLKENEDSEAFRKKLLDIKVDRKGFSAYFVDSEIVKKNFSGKELEVLKAFVNVPGSVVHLKDQIREMECVKKIYEYDILYTRRYLVDKGITPLILVDAEGDYINQKSKVSVFDAILVEQKSNEMLENPRILAFDIETYSASGDILPEKNPILMIAFYAENYKKVLTWKKIDTKLDYVEFVKDETELLIRIKDVLNDYKPDIITGYYSDGFDMPYIKVRAELNKLKLDLGLDFSDMKLGKGRSASAEITGIVHLDVLSFIRKVVGRSMKTDVYSLNEVAHELLGEKKLDVDLNELSIAWDKSSKKLEQFMKYNLHDAKLTYQLLQKLIPQMFELVKIVGLSPFDLTRMSISQLVEWYILKQAKNFNEIAPNKPGYNKISKRKQVRFKGAFVFEPNPGFYKNIVIFDYRSLYPTIISSHNISPSTLNCKCCEGEAELTPDNEGGKYWFCKKKKGFISSIMEDLITRRMRIKEMTKKGDKSVFLYARQQSLKLLANSFYGYLGFFGARWYSLECAQSVTAYGRYYIHKVIDKAKEAGFKVLYSDTDSVFLTLDGKNKDDAMKFAEDINMELPGLMELEYEGFYPAGLFVSTKEKESGAKKKYALLADDDSIKIKGFETVRRNVSIVAKEMQRDVLEIILKEEDFDKALTHARTIIEDLRTKKIPNKKVIIQTQLQKGLDEYDQIGPHVAVARRMAGKGINVGSGSTIKYLIIQGKGKIRDRARLLDEVEEGEYDADYYINNQIMPSVERIFHVLGYTTEDISENKEQSDLKKFF